MSRSPRSRARETQNYISYQSGGVEYSNLKYPGQFEIFDDFLSSDRTSYNPCLHIKINQPFNGLSQQNLANFTMTKFLPVFDMELFKSVFEECFTRALTEVDVQAEFQKNNSFELLNLVADLDNTIAMFTTKFWRELTYGSVNWGLLPFVSDLKSLKNSLDDIFGGRMLSSLQQLNKRRALSFTVNQEGFYGNPATHKYVFSGVLRLRGDISTSLPTSNYTALLAILDELGVHPDLRTIWDIIPLSFVLDYFFPVGDILESLHPRGWLDLHMFFRGQASLAGKLTIYQLPRLESSERIFGLRSEGFCYRRSDQVAFDPSYNKPPLQDYKFGLSLRQLFNLAYLGSSSKR